MTEGRLHNLAQELQKTFPCHLESLTFFSKTYEKGMTWSKLG